VWEVERMPVARYIEAKTFGVGNIIPNLHKVMASCVLPMRKNWYGKWKPLKYDARKHSEYATDLQDAKFTDVYNCVVFFYPLFDKLMESFLPYSINLMNQQIDQILEERLQKTTDGSTISSGSLSSSGLP
jgi:hypothetical protein